MLVLPAALSGHCAAVSRRVLTAQAPVFRARLHSHGAVPRNRAGCSSSHVAAFAEAGAERVLFTLPNAGADKVLPVLDKLAKLHA